MKQKSLLSALAAALGMSTGLGSVALAATCEFTIGGDDQMRFVKPDAPTELYKTMEADASCKEVKVTIKNIGKLPKQAMGHNWILTSTPWAEVAPEAAKAGLAADYVPKTDKRVVAYTKLVGPGESDTVTFKTDKLEKGKAYDYLCGFPAHANAGMVGKFTLKAKGSASH